ncbi:MAG: shikimate kinase [Phycisphaera sp. TMED9]|nr:MAG: shikimate kinase [Phycisphaera sp. TMED9]
MHLILIGLRGSGKSTAGRATADLVSRPFIDLDERTEAFCGSDATTCFKERGEAAWRDAETAVLQLALDETTPSIIALGGGTPTAPGAAAMLHDAREGGRIKIAWLNGTPANLAARIAGQPGRPALTDLEPAEEMRMMLERRGPIFGELANARIEIDDRPRSAVVADLVSLIS